MPFPTSSTRPDRPSIPAPRSARPIVIGIFSGLLGIVADLIVDRQILQPSHSPIPLACVNIPMPIPHPVSTPAVSDVSFSATSSAPFASKDLASRIQALASENDRDRRLFALRDLVNSIAIKDMPSALDQANAIKRSEFRMNFLKLLLSRWAEAEPQTALKYAQALPRLQEQKLAVLGVLDCWVGQDVTGAAAWALSLPPGDLRNHSWPVLIASKRTWIYT